jgi:multiple sugar transport system substrate-binding protein
MKEQTLTKGLTYRDLPRRRFLGTGGGAALAAVAPGAGAQTPAAPRRAKRLRILQSNHFVPAFDEWFNNSFIKEWGEKNDTEVLVTNVGMTSIEGRAEMESRRGFGHDICMFLSPPASYEDFVIDHRDIYAECERRYGKPLDIAIRSTFNPVTNKFFGFSDAYVPDPVNYRKDLWDDVGVAPTSWDGILEGGRRIRRKHGITVGIGMSNELDSSMALRSLLVAFGAAEQTADSRPNLRSREALEALKFAKALYTETMTDEVFSWDASSNNRQMLAGKSSVTLNAISITRTGESEKILLADKIFLAKPAAGPAASLGVIHLMNAYVVWKFSSNIDGAKQFLVDLVGQSRRAFAASGFYNFPTYPQLVPDLVAQMANDRNAKPADKYAVLSDAATWTINVGYPGYANAAIDEIWKTWLIPRMFSDAASGRQTPEAALDTYAAQIDTIYRKWRELKKV